MKIFTRFNILVFLTIVMIFVNIFYFFNSSNEIKVEVPKVILEQPSQKLVSNLPNLLLKGAKLTPVAEYEIKARVLSKKAYSDDFEISPIDLVLGWDIISNQTNLEELQFTQMNRDYTYRYTNSPLTRYNIRTHSSNNQIIPANENITKILSTIKVGKIVTLRGYLVNIEFEDGRNMISSLSREDEDSGSSEILYLREIDIIG